MLIEIFFNRASICCIYTLDCLFFFFIINSNSYVIFNNVFLLIFISSEPFCFTSKKDLEKEVYIHIYN